MEMSFLPAILYRPLFRSVVAAACICHLAAWFLFGIIFWASVLAYGVLVPFTRFCPVDRLIARASSLRKLNPIAALLAAMAMVPVWILLRHSGSLPLGPNSLIVFTGFAVSLAWTGRGSGVSTPHLFPAQSGPSVVLFDGVCGLCNRWVDFLLRHDKRGRLLFASLQSEPGRRLVQQRGLDPDAMDSIVVVRGDRTWRRSDAVAEIAVQLGFPYSLATAARLIPRPFRDAIYDWVARHRYRWFGRRETCRLPTPEERERFLAGPAEPDAKI